MAEETGINIVLPTLSLADIKTQKEIEAIEKKCLADEEATKLSKLETLRYLLESQIIIPPDAGIFSDFSKYEPAFDDIDREIMKKKIFQIIKTL